MVSSLKKNKVKLHLLIYLDMSLMITKSIGGGICNAVYQSVQANNKCIESYGKNKESSYLKYWNVNNLHGRLMSHRLPVNNFKWVK